MNQIPWRGRKEDMDEMQALKLWHKGPDEYVLTEADTTLIRTAVLDAFDECLKWENGKWWCPLGSIPTLGHLRSIYVRLAEIAGRPYCVICKADLRADNRATDILCKACATKGA
jgi:hypothetical protein